MSSPKRRKSSTTNGKKNPIISQQVIVTLQCKSGVAPLGQRKATKSRMMKHLRTKYDGETNYKHIAQLLFIELIRVGPGYSGFYEFTLEKASLSPLGKLTIMYIVTSKENRVITSSEILNALRLNYPLHDIHGESEPGTDFVMKSEMYPESDDGFVTFDKEVDVVVIGRV